MQRTLTQDDRSVSVAETNAESFCLVCDAPLTVASSTNIFYTSLPRNGELLASFVLRVLRPVASDLRSSYICSRCNQLFQMLEQAQWTVSNIRCEILKVYRSRASEKALERKVALSGGETLSDVLFVESEQKTSLESDRFDVINEFRVLDVADNVNIASSDAYDDSPNDFCDLNIVIGSGDKKIEVPHEIRDGNVYGSKIDCLKVLHAGRNDFHDSPNDFCDLNIGIDKKDEKLIEIRQNNVYEHKIDCLKALESERRENAAGSESFNDSQNNFCDLNIVIGDADKKVEKLVEIRQNSVYEDKIDCLKALESERDENVARNDAFSDSQNDFCHLNIGIVGSDKKPEKPHQVRQNSAYGRKIEFKAPIAVRDDNIVGSEAFDDPPNNFCDLNIVIDNADKKVDRLIEIRQNSVYEDKIDCLKTLNDDSLANVAVGNAFDDSPSDYCSLNIEIADTEKKLVKSLENRQKIVYEGKIDCSKIEDTAEIAEKREVERRFKKCSKNAQNLAEKTLNDLPNSSIGRSAETLAKVDERARYTLQCRLCPRLFKLASDLRSHSLKHGGSLPYYCRKCNERFADLPLANGHATDMHSSKKNCIAVATKPRDNEVVDFTGDDWIVFEESENIEETESCNKRSERNVKSGRISKYSLKPLKYPCSTCGKKWRTSAELKTHVKSHSNLRPYMCEKCGQAYKHKHALEIHVGMHNGISPYQCSVCNKCFTQKGALMRHLPMHTGEMPYQCELCGKRFVHHTSYNMHELSHTGKKSYQCHVCDLSLLSTSHLKRHMRVHTGEKPYSCELCGKSFAERYNLFAHQKIHDPAEIMARAAKKNAYKCEQCDEFFDKKQKLEDHTRERHSDATNGRKWIGHTIDLANSAKTSNSLVDQSWQDYNYSKLQGVVVGMKKPPRLDNSLSQMSHETVALLMSQMAVMIQPTNSTTNEIDHTQI